MGRVPPPLAAQPLAWFTSQQRQQRPLDFTVGVIQVIILNYIFEGYLFYGQIPGLEQQRLNLHAPDIVTVKGTAGERQALQLREHLLLLLDDLDQKRGRSTGKPVIVKIVLRKKTQYGKGIVYEIRTIPGITVVPFGYNVNQPVFGNAGFPGHSLDMPGKIPVQFIPGVSQHRRILLRKRYVAQIIETGESRYFGKFRHSRQKGELNVLVPLRL